MRRTFTAYTLVGTFSFVLCLANAHAQYTITDLGRLVPPLAVCPAIADGTLAQT